MLAGEAGLLGRLAYRFARYRYGAVPEVAELDAELGHDGLVELTYAIAVENQRSRFNHALGITDQGFTSGAACCLPSA